MLCRISAIYSVQVNRIHMHAHSYYLQTWAEQGLLGFIALVSIAAVAFWQGAVYLKSAAGFRRVIVFAAYWSFAALSIHNLVDAGPASPAVFGFWAVLGLMFAAGKGSQQQSGRDEKEEYINKENTQMY